MPRPPIRPISDALRRAAAPSVIAHAGTDSAATSTPSTTPITAATNTAVVIASGTDHCSSVARCAPNPPVKAAIAPTARLWLPVRTDSANPLDISPMNPACRSTLAKVPPGSATATSISSATTITPRTASQSR
jgi:hypothetical protein